MTTAIAGGAAKPAGEPIVTQNAEPSGNPLERLVQMQDELGRKPAGTTETKGSPESPAKTGDETGSEETAEVDEIVLSQSEQEQAQAAEQERLADKAAELGITVEEVVAQEAAEKEAGPAQLPAELAALPDDVRAELLAIAREVLEGKTSFREIKRGHKLISKHAEEVDRLNAENERLKTEGGNTTTAPASLPESVSRLKTPDEIAKRQRKLEEIMDWCEDNAGGGESNGQSFSADDVKIARHAARDELRLLPQRAAQLQNQAAFAGQQQKARGEALKMFPQLKNPEHAETKAVTELLEKAPWMRNVFASPEAAALTWLRGQAALKAELAKRTPATARTPAATRAGEVPRARPSSGGSGASGKPAGGPTVAKAKERIGSERSVSALAALMEASPGLG